ncbi:protein-L-isoaspartate(D-aspartate) O-methyltransferase [Haloplanus halobius]|uniref:protein-L-isoaspartate(D-aspartate) O-methyltransferase n=1 Tax=Haloplanus halobius TaxID=2934938 RepID=UPI00201031A2|nr:protein-L-isoaspartate(D-aspartate) O-methyltransferase [Haloplanus sp. XH21]
MASDPNTGFDDARAALVDRLIERGYIDRPATERAMRAVPRHAFVPDPRREAAYRDRPLPIGAGQTISAPHMVAVMTDLLAPAPDDDILEIGTGCGYHAAVTSEPLDEGTVFSVEAEPELARAARARFARLGYDVRVCVGDGHEGWAAHAPYDGAYLTCAPETVPEAITEQVRPGGTVVAPVGRGQQELLRLTRRADGSVERERHGSVRFVPMRATGVDD